MMDASPKTKDAVCNTYFNFSELFPVEKSAHYTQVNMVALSKENTYLDHLNIHLLFYKSRAFCYLQNLG